MENQGLILADASLLTVTGTLNNTGTLSVQAGTLATDSGFTSNAGSIVIASGGTWNTTNTSVSNSGTIQSAGTINVGTGTLTNASGGILRVGASPGLTSITGNLTLSDGSITEIDISGLARGVDPGYDAINVSDNVTIESTARFDVFHQGGFVANVGDSFRVITAGGTLFLPSGTGSLVIVPPSGGEPYVAGSGGQHFFLQRGTMFQNVNVWNTDLSGNWATAGNWSLGVPVAGQIVLVDRGAANPTVTVNTAGQAAGVLLSQEALTISGGSLSLGSAITDVSVINGNLTLSGGTISGAGTVTLNNTGNNWTSGGFDGAGKLVVASGAALSISGATVRSITNGYDIDNAGTVTMTQSGQISATGPGITTFVTNTGTWNANHTASFGEETSGGSFRFNNTTGTMNRTAAGTGTILNVTNSGTANIQAGTLQIDNRGGFTSSGNFSVDAGATLSFVNVSHTITGGFVAGAGAGTILVPSTNTLNLNAAMTIDDTLSVSGGTLNANASVSIGGLNLSSGTIQGSGNVTAGGPFNWSGGTLAGTGTFTTNGSSTLSGAATKTLTSRTWNNFGTATWTGGTINLSDAAATINNQNLATFHLQNASGTHDITGPGTFNNLSGGSVVVNAPVMDTSIFSLFNSAGTVSVTTGHLGLDNGGTDTGSYSVASGQILHFFAGTRNLNSGASVTGAGEVRFSNASTTNVNTGAVFNPTGQVNLQTGGALAINTDTSLAAGATFNLSGGTLQGTHELALNGAFNWTSGTMSGTGSVRTNAISTLSGASTKTLASRTWNNFGTATWTDGTVNLSDAAATINNQNLATFHLQNTSGAHDITGPGTFNNFSGGSVVVNAPVMDTSIFSLFNNAGGVAVNVGHLGVDNSGTDTGSYSVASGQILNFFAGTRNFNSGTAISGAGETRFSNTIAAHLNSGASINSTGQINVSGGTLNLSGGLLSGNGSLNVGGGSLTVNSATSLPSSMPFNFNSGNVAGGGALTIGGTATWTGGTMSGSGTTTLSGTSSTWSGGTLSRSLIVPAGVSLALTGTSDKNVFAGTLDNSGTVTWNGAGRIVISGPAGSVQNRAGALFDMTGDGVIGYGGTPGASINNAGTFRKSGGTGNLDMTDAFIFNSGTIDLQAGNILMIDGSDHSGVVNVAPGRSITFAQGFNATTIRDGTVFQGGGTFNFTGAGSVSSLVGTTTGLQVTGAGTTVNLSNHTLNGAGNMTVGSGAVFNWTGGALSGAGLTTVASGATMTVNSGGTLATSRPLNNQGTVSVTGGTLQLAGGGIDSGAYAVTGGATLEFSAARTLNAGSSFSGAGTVNFNDADVNVNTNLTIPNPVVFSGSNFQTVLSGSGNVVLNGTLTWQDGADVQGTGMLTTNNATSIISDGAGLGNGRTWNNNGTVTISGAGSFGIFGPTAGSFTNSGVINLTGSSANPIYGAAHSGHTFTNQGTLNKQAGSAAIQTIGAGLGGSPLAVSNAVGGAIDVASGTLAVDGGSSFTQSGTIQISSGTIFQRTGGFTNTGTLQGSGTINLGGATLTNSGTIRPGTSPGLLTITGNLTLTGSSVLDFELGGLARGTQYDAIDVSGNVILAGTANITHFGGFTPVNGNSFQLINCAAGPTCMSGNFGTVNLPSGYNQIYAPPTNNFVVQFATCAGSVCWDNDTLDGLWSTAANWSTDVLPTSADDVQIPDLPGANTILVNAAGQNAKSIVILGDETLNVTAGGTLTVANASTALGGTLALTGGTLSGAGGWTVRNLNVTSGLVNTTGNVTVNTGFTWQGGTIAGSGANLLTTGPGSASTLNGGARTLTSRTWNNAGTVNWQDGSVNLSDAAAIINNQAGGVWNILTASPADDLAGAGAFNNLAGGVIEASASGLSNSIHPAIVNHAGTLNLNTGDLDFDGNVSVSFAGALTMANGTRIKSYSFLGTPVLNFDAGATISVLSGSAQITQDVASQLNFNAPLTLPSGLRVNQSAGTAAVSTALTVASGGLYNFSGGTLTGSGSLQGSVNWTGGTINGALTNTGSAFNITGAGSKTLSGGTLTNTGVMTWDGAGTIFITNNSQFNNNAGATFAANGNGNIDALSGVNIFVNNGSFTKASGAGTLAVFGSGASLTFHNAGVARAQSGTLQLPGGTLNGTLQADAGAQINLLGGVNQLGDGALLSGGGSIAFLPGAGGSISLVGTGTGSTVAAGTTFNLAGTAVGGGGRLVNQGTFNFANSSIAGSIENQGTLNVTGTSSVNGATFDQNAGVIALPAGATLNKSSGAFNWSGGAIGSGPADTGALAMISGATFNVTGSGARVLNGPTVSANNLNLAGGSLALLSGALNAAGTSTIGSGATLALAGGSFNPSGPVNINGILDLDIGTTSLGFGGTHTGTIDVAAGATLALTGGTHAFGSGSSVVGSGLLSIGGGTASFAGSAALPSVAVSGGALDVLSGTLAINDLVVSAGAVGGAGAISVGGALAWGGGTLNNTGGLTTTGTTAITGAGPRALAGPWTNSGTATIAGIELAVNGGATNTGTITLNGASAIRIADPGPAFTNAAGGILNINSTAGWSFVSNPFTQGGLVNNAGTINVNNGTSWEAAYTNTPSGFLNLAAGTFVSMQNGKTLSGAVNLGTGSTLWVSEWHGSNAAFTGTAIGGNGTVQVLGSGPIADFTNVNAPAATLLIGSGGTINLAGTSNFANFTHSGGTLGGAGSLSVTGGWLPSSGSVLNGMLTLLPGSASTLAGVSVGGGGTVTNQGALTLANSTLSTSLNNLGTMTVGAGTSTLGGTVFDMNGGTLTLTGTLDKSGGAFNWNVGTLTGSGALTLSGGATTVMSGPGARVLDGPTLTTNNLTLGGGSLTVKSGTLNASGTTSVAGGALLSLQGGAVNAAGGTVDCGGVVEVMGGALTVGTLNVQSGGLLRGTGTVTGNVINGAGTVSPGASPGILTIAGNYVQGAGGTLAIELGGTTPGTYDQLMVTGNATLGGSVTIALSGGFVPVDGDSFSVVQAGGTVSGTFASSTFPPLQSMSLEYLTSKVNVLSAGSTILPASLVAATESVISAVETGVIATASASNSAGGKEEEERRENQKKNTCGGGSSSGGGGGDSGARPAVSSGGSGFGGRCTTRGGCI